jgi:hypothetical protein
MSEPNHSSKSAVPSWSPRVRPEKISRLYRNAARGLVDSDLIEDVGTTLFCRCASVLIVCDAAEGRVACDACGHNIARAGDLKDQTIRCGRCGWSIRWADYQKTYRHRELYAGGITDAVNAFMARWPRAPAPREKPLLIDRLIHVWHWASSRDHRFGRPAAVNLIEGSRKQVLELLSQLSGSAPAVPSKGI